MAAGGGDGGARRTGPRAATRLQPPRPPREPRPRARPRLPAHRRPLVGRARARPLGPNHGRRRARRKCGDARAPRRPLPSLRPAGARLRKAPPRDPPPPPPLCPAPPGTVEETPAAGYTKPRPGRPRVPGPEAAAHSRYPCASWAPAGPPPRRALSLSWDPQGLGRPAAARSRGAGSPRECSLGRRPHARRCGADGWARAGPEGNRTRPVGGDDQPSPGPRGGGSQKGPRKDVWIRGPRRGSPRPLGGGSGRHQIPPPDLASCVCSHSYTVAFCPVPACIFSIRSSMKTGPAPANGSPPLSRGSTTPMPPLALSSAKAPTCSLLCERSASSCNCWSGAANSCDCLKPGEQENLCVPRVPALWGSATQTHKGLSVLGS